MKTQDIIFLNELQEELKTQTNDGNASPVFWVIRQYEDQIPIIQPDTFFITKKEAQQHIYDNQNHYNNTVHTYAMTAWRSRVVERLWDILRTADFNSLKEENNEREESEYFEYTQEEYYALIKAESKKKANYIYWRDVVGHGDETARTGLMTEYNPAELTKSEALEKFLSADEEATPSDFYESVTNYVVLVDSCLI
ncbi:hypothetical protein [Listeria monocytogenes]|uniref:hypothetical protein n=1 Tax=Listeria monocytogenes TaxID=1639 RepID=UPI003159B72E